MSTLHKVALRSATLHSNGCRWSNRRLLLYYFNATVHGQAIINPSTGLGLFSVINLCRSDPFTVTVTDDLGGTTEQVVSITITAPDSDGDGDLRPSR